MKITLSKNIGSPYHENLFTHLQKGVLMRDHKTLSMNNVQGMADAIHAFPDHLREARTLAEPFSPPIAGTNKVVILGMGGSAIGGDLLKVVVERLSSLPVQVIRNEEIPNYIDQQTLVFVVSYSGNTQETIAALRGALYKSEGKVVAITTGGQIGEASITDTFPCLQIPGGLMPRAALAYSFLPMLKVLQSNLLIPDQNGALDEAIQVLKGLRDEIGSNVPAEKNPARQLAKELLNKIPIIYSSTPFFTPAARRWKCQINENAKQPAYFDAFPEVTHNEIVAFTSPLPVHKDMAVIMLRDSDEPERTKRKIGFMKKTVEKCGCPVRELFSRGQSVLTKLLTVCYYSDFVSLYLAELRGIDPTPITVIDELKQEMTRLEK